MVSTVLPDIKSWDNTPSKREENAVIFASTSGKYFYPEHKTPYLFVSNFRGKGGYVLNKKHIEISDKHFYFLNANDNLEILFSKEVPLQTLMILFGEEFIKDCFSYCMTSGNDLLDMPDDQLNDRVELPNVPFEYGKTISNIVSGLLEKPLSKEDLDDLLFELVTESFRLRNNTIDQMKRIDAVKRSTREELYRRLLLAREIMEDNIYEKLTVEQLAQQVCLNKFHFLVNFKDLFGTTPHQYFVELKLRKAFQLLQTKQHSVAEVCYQVGFESPNSFCNSFKKRFAVSPSALLSKN